MKRRMAIRHQIASTTPNGQAPLKKPYKAERAQPKANATTKFRCRRSRAYMHIMKVSATAP